VTRQELELRIALGEDSSLELKEVRFAGGRVSAPRREALADELAALANGRGGVCVLGVRDTSREVVGIAREHLDDAEAFVREICNDSIEPPLVAHIVKREIAGAAGADVAVLVVEVPRSLFVHRSPGGYFHRVGSSKRVMSTEYLARLFAQRSQSRLVRFDEQIVADATLDDLKEALWTRFRSARAPGEPREALLSKLRLARADDDGTLRPTVSGVLLAAPDPRRFLPNAYIQAVAYKGTTAVPSSAAAPYQLDAADITGPIDEQVVEAVRFVARNMRVHAFKDLGRRDVPQFDLTAVFEALVNAVAHRDYAVHGSKIRLRVFADRLEIMSPGGLPNTMTVESLPLLQAARNEVLTSLLARTPIPSLTFDLQSDRTTFMDRRGEGVNVILDRSEKLSGRKPDYAVYDDAEVHLTIWAAVPPAAEEAS
jgi:predicted HTH transcriptional regulator